MVYEFTVPTELARIYNVFHVSMLRQYRSDPSHMLKASEIEIAENLNYVEKPVIIVDYRVKQLWDCGIPMVKVVWRNQGIEEATWETEEKIKRYYPHLFHDIGKEILRKKF